MARAARILLVDDEPSIQRGLMPLLTSRGYDVESATTGQTALTAFGRVPPDVIILDLGLPDLEGSEVCRRVRLHSPVPIIVLTACVFEPDQRRAQAAGCDVFLPKPCLPDRLVSEIRAVLARRRLPTPRSARTHDARASAIRSQVTATNSGYATLCTRICADIRITTSAGAAMSPTLRAEPPRHRAAISAAAIAPASRATCTSITSRRFPAEASR